MIPASQSFTLPWLDADGPEAAIAPWTQCSLVRNLGDFAFPSSCTEEERQAVEERVRGALDSLHLLANGQYYATDRLSRVEVDLIAECRFVPAEPSRSPAHSGAYIADDQMTGIAVNGADHLCVTMFASGLEVQHLWTRLGALDDRLASALDYAFDKRYGFLTSSLGHVGTGLKASVILHLPALAMGNGIAPLVQMARQRRQAIYGLKPFVLAAPPSKPVMPRHAEAAEAFYYDLTGALYGDVNEAQGDLYLLTNLATLGAPEEEILFHLRRTATEIIGQERTAREALVDQQRKRIEDRVWRAFGVARTARLLGLTEAVSLLSSLRLGIDAGFLFGYSLKDLNELLLASQSAHLKRKAGARPGHDARPGRDERDAWDEYTLSVERADLFRARFARVREGV